MTKTQKHISWSTKRFWSWSSTHYGLQWSNVVFDEKSASGNQEWKNLPQKKHKQVFPYIKEHEFDLDQNIFSKSVPLPEIIHLEKQMNPSCYPFVDLPLFAIISKRDITTLKVATRRSSRITRAPLKLVDFSCIITINEPLMWQAFIR